MKSGTVVIHLLNPDAISAAAATAMLNSEEQQRANRFRAESDARRWSSFRAQMRRILGDSLGLEPLRVPLTLSDQGKPLLSPPHDGLHFNLSHCAALGILGLCRDGPIGVDIESLDRGTDLPECESMFCHPVELAQLPENRLERARRLLEIWTAKEAILKALGTGLLHPPECICIDLSNPLGTATSEPSIDSIADLRIHPIQDKRLKNYLSVVAAPLAVNVIQIL